MPPQCIDGYQDDDETDVDCGGPSCVRCDVGKKCNDGLDCGTGVCLGGQCQKPTCTDGVENRDESDVDCGGSGGAVEGCPRCPTGAKCRRPDDCESGVCLPTGPGYPDICAAPTCTDGMKNGGETGMDCGGSDIDGGLPCPPCADGGP